MTAPGVLDRVLAVEYAGVTQLAWVSVAIVLLLIIAYADPKVGGYLLILIVMGMVYAAHWRNPPLI